MTEAEWLASDDPRAMLRFVRGKADMISDRKQRLMDCACVRRVGPLLTSRAGMAALELAERYADGGVTADELRAAQAAAMAEADAVGVNGYCSLMSAAEAAWEYRDGVDPLRHAVMAVTFRDAPDDSREARHTAAYRTRAEMKVQAGILRDIVGNPFRPVRFDPAWRTDAAVGVATLVYDARDFSAMPILADALQDAGCDDPGILEHCRAGGPHCRGCWVVDGVLCRS